MQARDMARILAAFAVAAALGAPTTGCLSVKTEHEVKPIHITLDVNLKVEKELDNFFNDIDAQ